MSRPSVRRAGTGSIMVAVAVLVVAVSTASGYAVTFEQLRGWWRAEAAHKGVITEVFVQFVEEDGQPIMKVSLPAIAVWNASNGALKIQEETVDGTDFAMPLNFERETELLHGHLPEAAVPVYKIPVVFKRSEPPITPPTGPPKLEGDERASAPKELWEYHSDGPIWAGLTFDEESDLVFIGAESGSLVALNADDGQLAWSVKFSGPIRAQATVAGNHVYLPSDDGHLYKLDKRTGREAWRTRIDAGSPPRLPITDPKTKYDRYASAAVVDGGRIYIGSRDGHFYALKVEDGTELWKVKSDDLVGSTPVVANDLVIFGSFDGKLRAIATADGSPKWMFDTKAAIAGDLVLHDDLVLMSSRSYDLFALRAATGEMVWNVYYWFSWIESPPAVLDGVAYVGSSDGLVFRALDVKTGDVRWSRGMPGWSWSKPAVSGNLVWAAVSGSGAHRQGGLVAFDRLTGEVRRALMTPLGEPKDGVPRGFAASPVVVKDRVIAADLAGKVAAYATE